MKNIPPRRRASKAIFALTMKVIRRRRIIPGILGVRKDKQSVAVVFVTAFGNVRCPVTEDDKFVFIEVPGRKKAPCFYKAQLRLAA